jgi:hypothetical protein
MIAQTRSEKGRKKFIQKPNFLSEASKNQIYIDIYRDMQKYWFSLRQEHKWKKLLNGDFVFYFSYKKHYTQP